MTKTKRLAIAEILSCKKLGITSKRGIAMRLVASRPDIFKNTSSARCVVQRILGSCGESIPADCQDVYETYIAEHKPEDAYVTAKKRPTVKTKHYIITSAVNGTPVFKELWNNILAYASHLNAEIYVIAMRYKNPTSIFSDSTEDTWCSDVLPYLDANRHVIHKTVEVMGDVKIQPTAKNPLNGKESLSGGMSCIFGHPRVHMKFLPVLKGEKPKMMISTGSVTLPNYTDSSIGVEGSFHHTYGFTIVSVIDKERADIHYVTARSDGGFIDHGVEVKDGIIGEASGVKGLILGDIHSAKLSEGAIDRMISTMTRFKPEVIVIHDVFDAESINPHEANDPILKHKKMMQGRHLLGAEIDRAICIMGVIKFFTKQLVVVNSNHDRFLDRYIAGGDWKKDLPNAITYAGLTLKALCGEANKGLFSKIVEERLPDVKCLAIDESYKIEGIELGNHGDIGSNGSKGSPLQFKKLSSKGVTGHTHSPLRLDGHSVVGCQDLDHEYNVGMSSWALGDIIINSDGKRQHIFYF